MISLSSLLFSFLLFLLYTQQSVCLFFDDFSDQVAFQENWQISTGLSKVDERYNVTWSDRNANVSARNLFLFVSTEASQYYGGEILTKQRHNFGLFEVSTKVYLSPGTSNTIIGLTNDGVSKGLQLRVLQNLFLILETVTIEQSFPLSITTWRL
eukprot:TRINITY_DN2262_c0_g1_i1.p1 TRINITY_DN2262_c0_g1~~TRINITY_DN2262_c0_g1_i1.p1  ORF type:complete len:154 (+),score=8.69 TRINITY_DN2262_c0_g1_i1:2-463(+)